MCKDRCMQVSPYMLDRPWLLLVDIAKLRQSGNSWHAKINEHEDRMRNEHWLSIMFTSQNTTSKDMYRVQVISSLIPLQRPWEGSRLYSSITGHPTLSASFAFGKPFSVRVCRKSGA